MNLKKTDKKIAHKAVGRNYFKEKNVDILRINNGIFKALMMDSFILGTNIKEQLNGSKQNLKLNL